jgi:hypothetical protein
MKSKAKILFILVVMLSLGLVLAACGAQAVPTATPAPPTAVPTPTPVPPTDTPIPPSKTPAPPTATPMPPTDTPAPTDTPVPPTETRVPPTAPPIQPTPGEIVATQVEDVVGIWLIPAAQAKSASQPTEHHLELTKEGGYRFTAGGRTRDSGQFWFEDTQFVIVWSECVWGREITSPCPSTYYVYVTKEGDKPVRLRFVMIDERGWQHRRYFHRQKLPLVEP